MIPSDDIEGDYSDLFPGNSDNFTKPARLVFGALIIKETLGLGLTPLLLLEKTESYIDIIYKPLKGVIDKLCNYRNVARADYPTTLKTA